MSHKKKNIILCADGTGNKGGYTPDSNVYKIYKTIDLHDSEIPQISFYDNGVGTNTNKYLRGIQGAFGFGFEQNVKDLYLFLSRNYREGDDIYLFGFSRGAATIRAFNGFVAQCGLIDGYGWGNSQLVDHVNVAFDYYKRPNAANKAKLDKLHPDRKVPTIKFIGAWDTVSALGFPKKKGKAGIGLLAIYQAFEIIGWVSDKIWPHTFYNYELTPNVTRACHAIAIDDERTIFLPLVWNEKTEAAKSVHVDQVWFAGMHSNIGGGYERPELANVSFSWMLDNIPESDLKFKTDVRAIAKEDSNIHGRLYNSRLGAAAMYSYHPRDVEKMCKDAGAPLNIHYSTMDRMVKRSANYAPKLLPKQFNLVGVIADLEVSKTNNTVHEEHWTKFDKGIRSSIKAQKWLYGLFVDILITTAIFTCYFSADTYINKEGASTAQKWIVEAVEGVTPDFFHGVLQAAIIDYPIGGVLFVLGIVTFFVFRIKYRNKTNTWAERLRKLYINLPAGSPHPNFPTKAKTASSESKDSN